MNAKETAGNKKEKSFNGSKAKFSPNPPVPDKKEVKLRRKESEKVKQTSDSTRKSVFGRFFHNLVDSDDSRKKNASTDTKKKRTTRDLESPGADLDLPEHGIILRNTQTLQRNQEPIPSSRARAATLCNQGRDNRNRWSSYDIHGVTNFLDGILLPPAMQMDASTLSTRSQSEETLNAALSADQNASKITGYPETVNHSETTRQSDVMLTHAKLLKSIEETNASKATRSEKLNEIHGNQAANGWLVLSGDSVINGQGKDKITTGGNIAEHKSNVSPDFADGSKKSGSENSVSSDSLVLLQEKSKEIDRALADKRRILSNLFKTPEEDMDHLVENAELSKDLTLHKMILISLLQSDRLTSVINISLVPHNKASPDGAVDKEVSNQAGAKSHDEQNASDALNAQTLQDAAIRLHQHLKLLTEMVNQEVNESNRLKQELDETQNRLKRTNTEKSLPDVKLQDNHDVPAIQDKSESNTSTEIQDGDIEQLSRDSELKLGLNDPVSVEEPVEVETELTHVSGTGEIQQNTTRMEQPATTDEELVRDKESPNCADSTVSMPNVESQSSANVSAQQECRDPGIEEGSVSDLKMEFTNLSAVQEVTRFESNSVESLLSNVEKAVESGLDCSEETNTDSVCDSERQIQDEESSSVDQSDPNRKFRNLESIPEDDDKLSVCDSEQKFVFDKDSNEALLENIVQNSIKHDGSEEVFSLDVERDEQSNTESNSQSNGNIEINYEADEILQSNMKAGGNKDADHIRSDIEDQSASADSTRSKTEDVVCDFDNGAQSDVNMVVVSVVQLIANEDGSVLNDDDDDDDDVSQCKPSEHKPQNPLTDHKTAFNVSSDDNPVQNLSDSSGIATDKEQPEIEKSLKTEIHESDQSADEEIEEILASDNDESSTSESEDEKEVEMLENVEDLLNSIESNKSAESLLLCDLGGNTESCEENTLHSTTEPNLELQKTVIREEKSKKGELSADGTVMENSDSNSIPGNEDQAQLRTDSLFERLSEDLNGNQDAEQQSHKLLSKEQKQDCTVTETVEIDAKDSCSDVDKISDHSNYDMMAVSLLKE